MIKCYHLWYLLLSAALGLVILLFRLFIRTNANTLYQDDDITVIDEFPTANPKAGKNFRDKVPILKKPKMPSPKASGNLRIVATWSNKAKSESPSSSVIASTSRAELKARERNTTQASITNFFTPGPRPSEKKESRTNKAPVGRTKLGSNVHKDEDATPLLHSLVGKWNSIVAFDDEDDRILQRIWKHYDAAHITYVQSQVRTWFSVSLEV